MSNTIDTLKDGDTLLVSAKGVKGGKVQLEFAEKVTSPYASQGNVLIGMLNKSDDRFSAKKPRRAWVSGEKEDIKNLIGIDVSALAEKAVLEINKLNPELNGDRLRLQVNETTKADAYQSANIDKTAKRAGDGGDFILNNGMHIFSNTDVVLGTQNHTFLKPDTDVVETPATEGRSLAQIANDTMPI
jgi:hypothetical protein